jgi:hypothetical protein
VVAASIIAVIRRNVPQSPGQARDRHRGGQLIHVTHVLVEEAPAGHLYVTATM